MNREIKFRAWDVEAKCMVLVNDARFVEGTLIGVKGIKWDNKVIVMQFTGLKDKNGKEIYEGDILQSKPYGKRGRELWTVGWDDKSNIKVGFSYTANNGIVNPLNYAFSCSKDLEVIGNIYENPDKLDPSHPSFH